MSRYGTGSVGERENAEAAFLFFFTYFALEKWHFCTLQSTFIFFMVENRSVHCAEGWCLAAELHLTLPPHVTPDLTAPPKICTPLVVEKKRMNVDLKNYCQTFKHYYSTIYLFLSLIHLHFEILLFFYFASGIIITLRKRICFPHTARDNAS